MGPCSDVVGTPAYVAPEALMTQQLDGRTDLYSFGVLLYYALTGRVPYSARALRELPSAWQSTPPLAHELVPEVPEALSRLAASLFALDRNARPRDIGEVMERLASTAGLQRVEPAATSHAYLATPTLVGRGHTLARTRDLLVATMQGGGGGLTYEGAQGVGRSRMLDAAVLEAKVLGASVIRVSANSARPGSFGAVMILLEQLHDGDPALFETAVRDAWSQVQCLFVGKDSTSTRIGGRPIQRSMSWSQTGC
jgi:hypothetical protein